MKSFTINPGEIVWVLLFGLGAYQAASRFCTGSAPTQVDWVMAVGFPAYLALHYLSKVVTVDRDGGRS